MPGGIRWFAENQPFTPITDTLRNLLESQPVGSTGLVAVAWTVAITALSFLWAAHLYNRRPAR
jgi:ABC-2 type transport system permease protein